VSIAGMRPGNEGAHLDPAPRSADFQVCCIAGFQTCKPCDSQRLADLEVGDTAGLETCATSRRGWSIGGRSRCARNEGAHLDPATSQVARLRQERRIHPAGHLITLACCRVNAAFHCEALSGLSTADCADDTDFNAESRKAFLSTTEGHE
jgi:hypothetical protein